MPPKAAIREVVSEEPGIVLEAFLPYRLNRLAALVSGALAEVYEERFALTIPGWRVMATLGQFGVCTARDIAMHGVMHKSTVSRAVSVLAERGLVARKPNGADRREELLELTTAGMLAYQALVPEALGFEAGLKAALSPAEQRTLLGLIEKLDGQARKLAPGVIARAAS